MKSVVLFISVLLAFEVILALDLTGLWLEDDRRRRNLVPFMFSIGLSYFERSVATKRPWQSFETISRNMSGYYFETEVGPVYRDNNYFLVPDNSTFSYVWYNVLDKWFETTCAVVDSSLMVYGFDEHSWRLNVVVNRTVSPNDPDVMIVTTTHWPLRVSFISYMRRLKIV